MPVWIVLALLGVGGYWLWSRGVLAWVPGLPSAPSGAVGTAWASTSVVPLSPGQIQVAQGNYFAYLPDGASFAQVPYDAVGFSVTNVVSNGIFFSAPSNASLLQVFWSDSSGNAQTTSYTLQGP